MANITMKTNDGYELQISGGNRKMVKGFGIFNLTEKVTCIGSTEVCRKNCYACKASIQYKNTVPQRRAKNTEAVNSIYFIQTMCKMLTKLSKQKGFKGFFRIHESGDFMSQSYVNAWVCIASNFPNIRFLAFTKSFSLDFSAMPQNVEIVYSVMTDTDRATIPNDGRYRAYAGDCHDIPDNTLECAGGCDNCGMCWQLSKIKHNVHFDMH